MNEFKNSVCSSTGSPYFHYEDQSVKVALFQKAKWNISTHPVVKKIKYFSRVFAKHFLISEVFHP
jgi:hypothetical protein